MNNDADALFTEIQDHLLDATNEIRRGHMPEAFVYHMKAMQVLEKLYAVSPNRKCYEQIKQGLNATLELLKSERLLAISFARKLNAHQNND